MSAFPLLRYCAPRFLWWEQPPHHQHKQPGARGVEEHVDQMIAEGGVAEDPVLKPEKTVEQRIILLRRGEVGPDAHQPGDGTQLGLGHEAIVVPDEARPQRRQVGEEGDGEQGRPDPEVAARGFQNGLAA